MGAGLDDDLDRLAVRVRRTERGDGESLLDLTVFCPLRGRTMSLDECGSCERCEGLTLESGSNRAFLRCHCRPGTEEGALVENHHRAGGRSAAAQTLISEVMTADVICVSPDLAVEALTAMFLERNISGAPVVDETGRPIGVVSKTDLVREQQDAGADQETERLLIRRQGYEVELGPGFHAERIARATVGEIMMPIAFTLPETASVSRAAALMALEGVHRLPVISEEGKVVGILSAMDILRWLAETEGYLVPHGHAVGA